MLFNSFAFVGVFLPIALIGYFFLSKKTIASSLIFLMFASIVFYSYWQIKYLPLLLLSIIVNFQIGKRIFIFRHSGEVARAKKFLLLGLVFDLGLLFIFKYLNFALVNLASLFSVNFVAVELSLPIGISFFTFTQIAFLVDNYCGKVSELKPINYGLFVTYFPHLIAGPILHHKDMMPQFDQEDSHRFSQGRLILGLIIFTIGLFKKIIIADGVARYVAPVFDVHYYDLTPLEAWAGALAYTFQLYFDFSAYCDMAYGLSYMFGVILPINFNSPYQSSSIIEFWRRWHITLSTFLRDYLYIPLGGNRSGSFGRYRNLLLTMLLGGLWHGANWTFIVWGGLHGIYLIVNHGVRKYLSLPDVLPMKIIGVVLTFVAVVIAWVFFRASSVHVASEILRAMFMSSHSHPNGILGLDRIMDLRNCWAWLSFCACVAFFTPNIYRITGLGVQARFELALGAKWGMVLLGALVLIIFLLLAIGETRGVSEFLYFNF